MSAAHKRIQVLVDVTVPKEVKREEVYAYMEDALRNHVNKLPAAHPMKNTLLKPEDIKLNKLRGG